MLQERQSQSKVTVYEEEKHGKGKHGKVKVKYSEWKFVAMIVDRLCFCIFTVFFVIATLITFRRQILPSSVDAPH